MEKKRRESTWAGKWGKDVLVLDRTTQGQHSYIRSEVGWSHRSGPENYSTPSGKKSPFFGIPKRIFLNAKISMSLIIHDPIQHASLFNCSHEKMCKGMPQNQHTLCGIACPAKRFILQKNCSRPFLEVAGEEVCKSIPFHIICYYYILSVRVHSSLCRKIWRKRSRSSLAFCFRSKERVSSYDFYRCIFKTCQSLTSFLCAKTHRWFSWL